MSRAQSLYTLLERVAGRRTLWRAGRWLSAGARREMTSNPAENGEYALQARLARHLAASGRAPVILDVGANLGAWSRPMGQALADAGAPPGRLVAFEPGEGQRARLTANLEGCPGFDRIEIVPAAMSAAAGEARFAVTGDATGSSGLIGTHSAQHGVREITVPVSTLDDVLDTHRLDRVDFVKIDTEGNDANVLTGGLRALAAGRFGALQFEYNWRWLEFGLSLKDVYALARETEYRVGKVVPEGIEIYDTWHFELDRFGMSNMILIRGDFAAPLAGVEMRFDHGNVAVPAGAGR